MSHNTFGHLFRVTTFGESHGPAMGCVVDGCPPGIPLVEADIQRDLDRRRPGQSKFVSQRREPDTVKILSGVFQDERMKKQVTTGSPIALLIENVDARGKDYAEIRDKFRPGHADYTYWAKYDGIRDYRGGGRQSARETAARVAAGAIARKVLDTLYRRVAVRGALVQIGNRAIDRKRWDWKEIPRNPFFCPDAKMAAEWAVYLDAIRKRGSSIGAIVEVVADGMRKGARGRPRFLSNQAGGILGGISSGQPIVVRFAVKPTSSILTPRRTIDVKGNNTTISTKGRHDPCVGIRAVPVGEAMLACVLADHALRHRAQMG